MTDLNPKLVKTASYINGQWGGWRYRNLASLMPLLMPCPLRGMAGLDSRR